MQIHGRAVARQTQPPRVITGCPRAFHRAQARRPRAASLGHWQRRSAHDADKAAEARSEEAAAAPSAPATAAAAAADGTDGNSNSSSSSSSTGQPPANNGRSDSIHVDGTSHATPTTSSSSSSSHHTVPAQEEAAQPLFGKDLKRLWVLAVPLILNNIAGYALSIIGTIYIGRLGALPLSASVLANSVYNCTGLSLALGLSAGMETLCGQAYGAGRFMRVGILLQRALLVCWTVCLPVALLWSQSHWLLLRLGQQPDIAALASRYLIFCIPCLFLTTAMECIRKYLQAQRAVKPAMAVAGITLAASPLFFWLLVEQMQLGLDGAAIAFIACQLSTLAGLLGVVMFRAWRMRGKKEQTWGGFSSEAFRGWGEYASYGLPAAAMIVLEWWAYEVIILLAGLLPDASIALSTMGICLTINAWAYMLPLGLGAAVNTSIGNSMGAGHVAAAKRAFKGGIASGFIMQTCLAVVITTQGRQLVQLFTRDPAVIASCCTVLPLLALLVLFDGINAVVSGVLRGSGRQALGAAINLLGYFVVGVPLAAWLAFQGGMGIHGFFVGVAGGAAVQAAVLLILLSRWDWRLEVDRVQLLLKQAADSGNVRPSFGH